MEPAPAEATTPQSPMMTSALVSPDLDPHASIALMTLYPSTTCPNTVCLPFKKGVPVVHRKNWEPLVLGPALAIDKIPAPARRVARSLARPVHKHTTTVTFNSTQLINRPPSLVRFRFSSLTTTTTTTTTLSDSYSNNHVLIPQLSRLQ